MRKTLARVVIGAAAVLALGAATVTPALASPSRPAGPPPPVSCGTKVFLSNTSIGAVDAWNSGDFIAVVSGHTDFCEVYADTVAGVTYHELEFYGLGNDCLSNPGGPGTDLGVNGCNSDHQSDEEWATTGSVTYDLAHGTSNVVRAYLGNIITLTPIGNPVPDNWVIVPG